MHESIGALLDVMTGDASLDFSFLDLKSNCGISSSKPIIPIAFFEVSDCLTNLIELKLVQEMEMNTLMDIVLGKPTLLVSTFRLSYYSILNLMRRSKGQFTTKHVIKNSFHRNEVDCYSVVEILEFDVGAWIPTRAMLQKKVEAQLVAHQQEAQKEKEDLKAKVEKWHNSSKNLSKLLNTQMSANDKFGLGYGDHRYDGILSYENEVLQSVFMNKESELEKQPLYDRFVTAGGMHAVPPPMIGNYMPSGPDIEVDYSQFTYGPKQTQPSESESQSSEFDTCKYNISTEPSELVSEPVVNESNVECQPKVWSDAPIIEEYESDSEDEYVSIPTKQQETPSFANQQVKTPRETVKNQFTHSQKPKVDKKELGYGFTVRACFVCGSLNHLIRDCDFHEKRMARKAELNNELNRKSSQREIRPIWNNVQRVNKQNQFVPSAVLTRTGKIPVNTARASGTKHVSTARPSFNRQTILTSTAMKVNTVKPMVNRVRPANVFHKTHSPSSRPFKKTTILSTNFLKQKVNTAKVNAVSTVGGKRETAVKPSTDYPHKHLKNKGIVDSGCSRHMTENKAYLADFKTLMCPVCFESENQANIHAGQQEANHNAGTEDIIDAGEDESAQDCFVLPIWSSYSSTITPDLKTDEKREGPREEEQAFLDELERLKRQEKEANEEAEALRKEFAQETENLVIQAGAAKASSTNIFSTVSTPAKASSTNLVNTVSIPVSTASPHEGLSLSDPTNPEQDDSEIPPLEDIYQNSTDGIFTNSSYDDEGAVADFTNLETIMNVSPIPTSRIISSHPSTLILGDPASVVQTRSKVNKSSGAHAFVSYVQKQRRNNHKDFQHCLFACFLSQNEPKKISEALEDESWVDAMQEELLQFKIQKVWILVDLPFGKKAIGTKEGTQDKTLFIKKDKPDFNPSSSHVDEYLWVNKENLGVNLKKIDFANVKTASTPIETQKPLVKDEEANDVWHFQIPPNLSVCQEIFSGIINANHQLGIWYPIVSSFDLESYSDSDYAGANLDRKSTTGGCQFSLAETLYMARQKQTIVATSTTEAENVSSAAVVDCPHRSLKNKGIVDSGCSRHMTRNKAYLAEF
ncbi:hypothetical protein Tco_0794684 [Tanacetum coccineum]